MLLRLSSLAILLAAGTLAASAQTSSHLAELRQITSGGQNAESYWSPDGKRLVFQSTRDGRECDQIYIMNADGSDVRMVSTGKGRTTCAYFLADGKRIVYASTHEGGDACPPPADRSKGYVWPIYATYDIFLATDDGKILRKLTDARGYDAEATVNWKTGRIVYTSLAGGDLDLWSMKSDGSAKRQLTSLPGYDGGAVYSRDGKKLLWRAMHPSTPESLASYRDFLARDLVSPMKMEIFIGDAGGENARQITNFGCASFAPAFTPDGGKILFASNKHKCDSHNFELYLMNLDGSGLEQVTDFGGFTSFPEFSPDGRKLAFTSSFQAKGRYEFNVFVAEWR
jgi:TolB protein